MQLVVKKSISSSLLFDLIKSNLDVANLNDKTESQLGASTKENDSIHFKGTKTTKYYRIYWSYFKSEAWKTKMWDTNSYLFSKI